MVVPFHFLRGCPPQRASIVPSAVIPINLLICLLVSAKGLAVECDFLDCKFQILSRPVPEIVLSPLILEIAFNRGWDIDVPFRVGFTSSIFPRAEQEIAIHTSRVQSWGGECVYRADGAYSNAPISMTSSPSSSPSTSLGLPSRSRGLGASIDGSPLSMQGDDS